MAEFFPIPPIGTNHFVRATTANSSPTSVFAPIAAGIGASAVVQLSGYGQLLSSVARFQNRLDTLRPRFASGASADFVADFGRISAGAQSLVDAFNRLQERLTDLQGIFASSVSRANPTQAFQQALNAQVGGRFDNGDSIFTSLARIGINFQPAALPETGGTLNLDLEALQNALNYDATGSFALLAQATRALDDIATRFAGQTANAAAVSGMLAQMQSMQMALSLTDTSISGAGFGMLDQAALPLTPGNANSSRQRHIALGQFNRVSAF